MYLTIDHASQFRDQFRQCGRGDQFSYEALNMLYEYLEEVDPQYELDVIALCCDYTESTPAEIARDYSIDLNDADPEADDYEEKCAAIVIEHVTEQGALVGVTSTGAIVYANY